MPKGFRDGSLACCVRVDTVRIEVDACVLVFYVVVAGVTEGVSWMGSVGVQGADALAVVESVIQWLEEGCFLRGVYLWWGAGRRSARSPR
jgi:hypothetical protein